MKQLFVSVSQALDDYKTSLTLRSDIPNEEWLAEQVDYAKERGRDHFNVPYMGKITGYFNRYVCLPVFDLVRLDGMRKEQSNVRHDDLNWLTSYMREHGTLPIMASGREEVPCIRVAYNGEAWVFEGNHRIMAAKKLHWQWLPVELRYFDGAENVESDLSPDYVKRLDALVRKTPRIL